MSAAADQFATRLLLQLARNRNAEFKGIGLVFYRNLFSLPHLPLGGPDSLRTQLPVIREAQIVATLLAAADEASVWHDGFHFVDIESRALTHLAQFLAPPLSNFRGFSERYWPSGARQAAAILTSMLDGIDCVGLVDQSGHIRVFGKGSLNEYRTE